MSIKLMSATFDNKDLNSTEKLVMLALADHANDEGESIYPSQQRLSDKTGLSRRTVNKIIGVLVEKGYLVKVKVRPDRENVWEFKITEKLGCEAPSQGGENVVHRGVGSSFSGGWERSSQGGENVVHTNHHINHQLNHHNKIIDEQTIENNYFDAFVNIFESAKGYPITDMASFTLMINNFKANHVIPQDFKDAITAQDASGKYSKSAKPTSYENWTLSIANKRLNPTTITPKSKKNDRSKLSPDTYRNSWLK